MRYQSIKQPKMTTLIEYNRRKIMTRTTILISIMILAAMLAFAMVSCTSGGNDNTSSQTPQAETPASENPQADPPPATGDASNLASTNDEPVEETPEPANSNEFSIDLGNGATLEMVKIPGGSFLMGSPETESRRDNSEGPQTQLDMEPFSIGKYEITQAQYTAVMGTNPSQFKGLDNNPVEYVSWYNAMDFCTKLSESTGKTFILPTEAQWEYACRAGTTTAYFWGDDPALAGDYAWFGENPDSSTHPVGQKQPNAWGLYDMSGNVWEWTRSIFNEYPYSETDGRNETSDTESMRTKHGGSWNNDVRLSRSAVRIGYYPQVQWFALGFRVACLDCNE
jgi:formylglycine-generating enzyme required for sulfatase activity